MHDVMRVSLLAALSKSDGKAQEGPTTLRASDVLGSSADDTYTQAVRVRRNKAMNFMQCGSPR